MESSAIIQPGANVHRGPSPGIVATVSVLLFATSLVLTKVVTNGAAYPMPYFSFDKIRGYFLQFSELERFDAMLQFGSAVPLGIFTAAITSRLKFHGVNASGVNIALYGGIGASIFIAISGLCGWVISQLSAFKETEAIHGFQLFDFITGGVAHVVSLGLLIAGVSVTAAFTKLIPRWMVWLGLATAVCCELSTLSLFFPIFYVFIPLGRFPGFIWMIAVGFTMPATRINKGQ